MVNESMKKHGGEKAHLFTMDIHEIKSLLFTVKQVQGFAAKEYGIVIPIRTIQEAMRNQPANPYGAVLNSDCVGTGRHKVWICTKTSAEGWVRQYYQHVRGR